jgi:hypothetical protein
MVSEFVAAVDGAATDAAWVKHYNFVDFGLYGSLWRPNYVNIVRHPVDRVRGTKIYTDPFTVIL